MYPESFLWWLGGTALIFGLLGLIAMLAWWVDHRAAEWQERKGRRHGVFKDEEEGRSSLWLVFEVLSAVFVVTGLLVAIYSDFPAVRALAGVAMVVLTSAATMAVLWPYQDRGVGDSPPSQDRG